jgi:Icc-related predicted phosphoesterase
MRILCLADKEEKGLWDYYSPEKISGIDLIISCGDLDASYLEFLADMSNKTILYVRGNHDDRYDRRPPLGCICIEDQLYNYKGLRLVGLGGSMKYGNKPDMYTEEEMAKRCRKLRGTLNFTNGFDILVTHAPAAGYGDMEDLAHQGFVCFNEMLEKYHPRYMIHGHIHQEYDGTGFCRRIEHPGGTTIINACGQCVIEIRPDEYPEEGKTGSAIYDWTIQRKMKKRRR